MINHTWALFLRDFPKFSFFSNVWVPSNSSEFFSPIHCFLCFWILKKLYQFINIILQYFDCILFDTWQVLFVLEGCYVIKFWESIIMMQRLFIAGFSLFITGEGRAVGLTAVCMVYLLLSIAFRPVADLRGQQLYTFSLLMMCGISSLQTAAHYTGQKDLYSGLSIFFVILVIIACVISTIWRKIYKKPGRINEWWFCL